MITKKPMNMPIWRLHCLISHMVSYHFHPAWIVHLQMMINGENGFFCHISWIERFFLMRAGFDFIVILYLENIFCFRNPWGILQYKIGKWNKFKFDIAFFRGINESKKSYFAMDDIQVRILYMTSEN